MGAVKEALYGSIESVFEKQSVEIYGEEVSMVGEVFDVILDLLDGDAESMHERERYWFQQYSTDTAEFLADWTFKVAAAITVFTGVGNNEQGLVGNSFASLALFYHLHPRRTAVAMQKMGLSDKAVQAIIYMLAGVILDQNDKLRIVKFKYLDEQ